MFQTVIKQNPKKKEKMGIIDLVKLKRLHEISLADESQKKYAEKFNSDP